MENEELEYVGFWPRVLASIIDNIIIAIMIYTIVTIIYGRTEDIVFLLALGKISKGKIIFFKWILPAIFVIAFWAIIQTTPGKMIISAKIVDAKTGNRPNIIQCFIRYIGYFVSIIPVFLGIVSIANDDKRQGWHDKLARTVVVRPKNREPKPVSFGKQKKLKDMREKLGEPEKNITR